MIRLLEEISLNSWPAFQTSLYDGWVIRFSGGFSRRSNSILPLYPSQKDVREKIRYCEAMYRERGLRTVFKMTPADDPPELDSILAEFGYRTEAETAVQTLPLRGARGESGPDVLLQESLEEDWDGALCALNAYEPSRRRTVRDLTRLVHPPRIFASVRREGRIVGCGLGVIRQGFLGCFDIVVDSGHRRRGLGKQIMGSLLDWGIRQSAETAFLQVMANNPAALEMYAGMGFREVYRYRYRVNEKDRRPRR
jgi:ribosomal protein S18 acetylase RimI-like enzyme